MQRFGKSSFLIDLADTAADTDFSGAFSNKIMKFQFDASGLKGAGYPDIEVERSVRIFIIEFKRILAALSLERGTFHFHTLGVRGMFVFDVSVNAVRFVSFFKIPACGVCDTGGSQNNGQ